MSIEIERCWNCQFFKDKSDDDDYYGVSMNDVWRDRHYCSYLSEIVSKNGRCDNFWAKHNKRNSNYRED